MNNEDTSGAPRGWATTRLLMGNSTERSELFLHIKRSDRQYLPVGERVRHFGEILVPLPEIEVRRQAGRCMDCGVPTCCTSREGKTGCPIHNYIPDWNDLVFRGNWEEAARNLHSTNNFPEWTGRVCPAPCENACIHNIPPEHVPVTIKTIECAIADRGFAEGWIKPEPPTELTGKKVAIVGSGPAGLACAQQLRRVGHDVRVFERHAKAGGLMEYGIPDYKKHYGLVGRRIQQMEAEGVVFHYGAHVGVNVEVEELLAGYDAVVLAGGAEKPRDLDVPGRNLRGIHFVMDFLVEANRHLSGESREKMRCMHARGKRVVILGEPGPSAPDGIGVATRQGARSIVSLGIGPRPPEKLEDEEQLLTWPHVGPARPLTSAHKEAAIHPMFSVMTTAFSGNRRGHVQRVHCVRVDEGRRLIPGTEFILEADRVFLSMGFEGPVQEGMLRALGVELDARGNVKADKKDCKTSLPKVFVAGDMRMGPSLVVSAIREGRQVAFAVDDFLMGKERLLHSYY